MLVVDDDPKIRDLLRLYLERDGHQPLFAADGGEALALARQRRPALILLDVMLPGIDGFEVCRRLRDETTVPIVLLTARSGDSDKVVGLDIGADDYVVKPFSPRELMARIRVQLRRRASPIVDQPVLTADGLRLDPNAVELELDGHPIGITPIEFHLLLTLMRRPGRVYSRDELITAVHGDDDPGIIDRTVDVHLGRLRRKLGDDAASPRFIATVRTMGYKFVAPVETKAAVA